MYSTYTYMFTYEKPKKISSLSLPNVEIRHFLQLLLLNYKLDIKIFIKAGK